MYIHIFRLPHAAERPKKNIRRPERGHSSPVFQAQIYQNAGGMAKNKNYEVYVSLWYTSRAEANYALSETALSHFHSCPARKQQKSVEFGKTQAWGGQNWVNLYPNFSTKIFARYVYTGFPHVSAFKPYQLWCRTHTPYKGKFSS